MAVRREPSYAKNPCVPFQRVHHTLHVRKALDGGSRDELHHAPRLRSKLHDPSSVACNPLEKLHRLVLLGLDPLPLHIARDVGHHHKTVGKCRLRGVVQNWTVRKLEMTIANDHALGKLIETKLQRHKPVENGFPPQCKHLRRVGCMWTKVLRKGDPSGARTKPAVDNRRALLRDPSLPVDTEKPLLDIVEHETHRLVSFVQLARTLRHPRLEVGVGLLQLFGHLRDIDCKLANFVAGLDLHLLIEVARGHQAHRALERRDGGDELSDQQKADQRGDEERGGSKEHVAIADGLQDCVGFVVSNENSEDEAAAGARIEGVEGTTLERELVFRLELPLA